jgi:hypothetical protein
LQLYPHTHHPITPSFFVFTLHSSIIAPQPRKGKGVSPPRDKQSVITVQAPKPPSSRAASPTPDIAQLIAEQMAIAQNNMAKLVAEQVALALAA